MQMTMNPANTFLLIQLRNEKCKNTTGKCFKLDSETFLWSLAQQMSAEPGARQPVLLLFDDDHLLIRLSRLIKIYGRHFKLSFDTF